MKRAHDLHRIACGVYICSVRDDPLQRTSSPSQLRNRAGHSVLSFQDLSICNLKDDEIPIIPPKMPLNFLFMLK